MKEKLIVCLKLRHNFLLIIILSLVYAADEILYLDLILTCLNIFICVHYLWFTL